MAPRLQSTVLVLALTVLWASDAAATHAKLRKAELLGEDAGIARQGGDLEGALTLLEAADQVYPLAINVYNMARCLEELGRLDEARLAYLRAASFTDVSVELRELATAGAEALAVRLAEARLRFEGVPSGVRVQLDGALLSATDQVVLPEGPHVACLIDENRHLATCVDVALEAGQHVTVAWPVEIQGRAVLVWTPADERARLWLDGRLLLLAPAERWTVHLAPGPHSVEVRGMVERSGRQVPLDLLPGQQVDLTPLLAPPPEPDPAPAVPPASADERLSAHDVGGWTLVGAGAAAAVVAGVLLGIAERDRSDIVREAHKNDAGIVVGMSEREALARWDDAEALSFAALGVGLGGVALAAAGATWLVVATPETDEGASVHVTLAW